MYSDLYLLRQQYGEVYVTVLPDETYIPWRQLTLHEFTHYQTKLSTGRFPVSHIEDEIFQLCCLDPTYIKNLDLLEAGIVTTVVAEILQVSGPSTSEEIQYDLNVARTQVQDFISEAVGLICQTFPGYTPEDIYNLDYQTFMKRLALAERRLLAIGFLTEPISVVDPSGEIEENLSATPRSESIKKRLVNLNPELPKSSNKIIITRQQMRELDSDLGGHDLLDKALWDHDVMDGLEYIYPELFSKLKNKEKITPDIINQNKGTSPQEIKQRHEEYINKLKSGELQPTKSKYLIADKLEGQAISDSKKKVIARVKRGGKPG